jgi:hypothetical protein
MSHLSNVTYCYQSHILSSFTNFVVSICPGMMMSCEACKKIVTSKRGEQGHQFLIETNRKKSSVIGQNIWFIDYECSACGTKWRYEDDKNDNHAGWTRI